MYRCVGFHLSFEVAFTTRVFARATPASPRTITTMTAIISGRFTSACSPPDLKSVPVALGLEQVLYVPGAIYGSGKARVVHDPSTHTGGQRLDPIVVEEARFVDLRRAPHLLGAIAP